MKNLLTVIAFTGAFNSFANPPIDSAQFYYSKGIEEKNAKRFLVASQHFEKAITFKSNYTEAYVENGYANLEMRKTDQAKENFTKAYEIQPSNTASIKELANLYFDYRQWDKAIMFAKKCSDCANADRIIGMSQYQKEDYPEAEKALLKAVSKTPNDAQVVYTLARTYVDMEEYKKAVPFFEKAITLDNTKSAWMNELGLLYYNNENFKGAVTAFEKAKEAGYNASNDFNLNLGYAALYAGEYEKGESLLSAVAAKKTGNKDLIRDLAQILYEKKQYDRSLVYCQKLLEANPKDGKALYQAGLNFLKKGDKNKGQGMCDAAIEMDPSLASKRTKSMDIGAL